jgi:hypothetical protein
MNNTDARLWLPQLRINRLWSGRASNLRVPRRAGQTLFRPCSASASPIWRSVDRRYVAEPKLQAARRPTPLKLGSPIGYSTRAPGCVGQRGCVNRRSQSELDALEN